MSYYFLNFNTPISGANLSTLLGVKLNNHGVKGGLRSLVRGKIMIESMNNIYIEVYSLSPTIALLLRYNKLHLSYPGLLKS